MVCSSGISRRSSRSGRMTVASFAQAHPGARRPPIKAEKEELDEQRQELDEQQSPELAMPDRSSGVQQPAGRLLIGISGPSGAGKTTLTTELTRLTAPENL